MLVSKRVSTRVAIYFGDFLSRWQDDMIWLRVIAAVLTP
jgi:hypothetical protein